MPEQATIDMKHPCSFLIIISFIITYQDSILRPPLLGVRRKGKAILFLALSEIYRNNIPYSASALEHLRQLFILQTFGRKEQYLLCDVLAKTSYHSVTITLLPFICPDDMLLLQPGTIIELHHVHPTRLLSCIRLRL
jgi:hypothetical protein